MAEAKKVPVRRCVGCGEHFPKNTLIRVLRTPSGEIVLDLHGKASGAILDELEGEKVDIIRYSDVIEDYIAEALSPAKVLSVVMEDERTARITVSPDQLSLAIGREGQNAKLVARLTGCKIDIKAD